MQKIIKRLSPFTKWITVIGLICLLYGIVAIVAHVNFFWESVFVGFFLMVVGIAGHMVTLIQIRKKDKRNTIGVKIGLGAIIFVLALHILLIFIISNSEAYSAAKNELFKNSTLQKDAGKITGFGFIPIGQLSTMGDVSDYSGDASFQIIVKGSKKYVFLSVTMHKNYGEEWKITHMN